MNFLTAGFPLGRWFGIRVIVSWLFVLYAASDILSTTRNPGIEALYMGVLFGCVLLHEFGHALACLSVGGKAEQILLWPLGGLAFVNPPPRPWPQLWTTVAGPLVNVVLIPVFWGAAVFIVPHLDPESLAYLYALKICEWGLEINVGLLAFNLLPVYPMDGGRILQEVLWFFLGYPRSLLIAGMVGTVGGLAFIGLGLGIIPAIAIPIPYYGHLALGGDIHSGYIQGSLVAIGAMAAFASFQTYRHAQTILGWQRR